MTINQFNIIDEPNQEMSTVMNEQRVTFRFWYSGETDRWSFDLSIDDAPVVHGRRVVLGTDLLKAFSFGIGKMTAVAVKSGSFPARDDLPNGNVVILSYTEDDATELLAT